MSGDDNAAFMEQVKFGIEVEAFLSAPVGRYLTKRIHREVDQALAELKSVNPNDAAAVRELQNRVYRAESIDKWLAEVVQEGWNAEEHLRSLEA